MNDFIERLQNESLELHERINKLQDLIESKKIDELDREQQSSLLNQLYAMRTSWRILQTRLNRLTSKSAEGKNKAAPGFLEVFEKIVEKVDDGCDIESDQVLEAYTETAKDYLKRWGRWGENEASTSNSDND
jgi:hypothetical protein